MKTYVVGHYSIIDVIDSVTAADSNLALKLLKYSTIREKTYTKKDAISDTTLFLNMLNHRNTYNSIITNNINKIKFAHTEKTVDIRVIKVIRFEDPWPEFGYTQYHSLNPEVPITALVITETSNNSWKLRLLSSGLKQMR